MPSFTRRVTCAVVVLLAVILSMGQSQAATTPIVVASKIDSEGALLGNIIAALLEARSLPIDRKIKFGPTASVRAAILAGQIDIYPEYTGNGALFFHSEDDPDWKDAARGYDKVRALDREQNHLIWLAPAPANNAWVIAVRQDIDGFKGHCLKDLADYVNAGGKIKLAASSEFVESPVALPAFERSYGFHLRTDQLLTFAGGNSAATLRAAAEGISGVNAAMAYGTDGELASFRLTALCDDKGPQVVYAPAPLVRASVLKQHPEIESALDPIFGTLTLETLQKLNSDITISGQEPAAVAESYLKSKKFLQ